jgi:outer membrane protein TolC
VGITLVDALRIASLANFDIAQARQLVAVAQAEVLRAKVLALPSVVFNPQYVVHTGKIQKTEGNIINMDRDSLWVGAGPVVSFGLADALLAPPIARQVRLGAEAGARRVTNDTLLTVADAYFAVLRARRRVARIDATLDSLLSERKSPLRSNGTGLLPLLRAFVETGAAAQADLTRVEVEVLRRQEEEIAALQELRLATAELARLLHLDPTVILWPLEDFRQPVPLPGEAWFHADVVELIEIALNNRPELAENRALVEAALVRLRTARWRPLLPSVVLNYLAGGFGGGPPLIPAGGGKTVFGLSGQITDFGPRSDFDVALVWRLQNMGFGNLAEIREQRARYGQFNFRALQVRDIVITQVVQAHESVRRTRERLRITYSALYDQTGEPRGPVFQNLERNFLRTLRGTGRPLETLDAIRSLSDMLDLYVTATTEFERARFRLLTALGMPAKAMLDPNLMPAPKPAGTPPVPEPPQLPERLP